MNDIRQLIYNSVGISHENQTKIFVSVLFILFLWLLHLLILRVVFRQTKNIKIRYQWKRTLSLIIPFIGIFLIGAIWLPAFEQFGAFLGLMAAGFAIALKDPLTNIAGWIFILIRKPFVVGDRLQIGKHAGDVIDIRLFQFTILEIGNWIDADQSTGRIIHLPNGKVFTESQANYSTGFEYIWNELQINITFESDWKEAKIILQNTINKHAEYLSKSAEKEIFEASKNFMIYYKHLTPIVYITIKEYGVQLTIRYLCNPRKRRSSENEIWEDILTNLSPRQNIQFAYPTTRFYKYSEGTTEK